MTYVFLILGLVMLFYGGNLLVDGSVSVAKRLGLSPLLIGLTLVGFGTSTPELTTSVLAALQGMDGISIGNVVGSNIANILLVLGVAAAISPVVLSIKSFRRDAVFLIVSSLMLLVGGFLGGIGRVLGILMTLTLIFYVWYSYRMDKKAQQEKNVQKEKTSLIKALSIAIVGIALTIFGAKLLVDSSVCLARAWGVSEAIIGLTIVAVGTSLPELATSIVSAIKGHNDVAFGNVVGSNIYNALFIMGITGMILPIKIQFSMLWDILMMMVVTGILIYIAFKYQKFSRCAGFIFLGLYVLYLIYIGIVA